MGKWGYSSTHSLTSLDGGEEPGKLSRYYYGLDNKELGFDFLKFKETVFLSTALRPALGHNPSPLQ
jgi:hypothetical protein